ncbi:MFS transporter [Klebsiella indica]|uniref:MFS transporter n=1 Tax=Klebsiella indica TaxID=2582917 RepID=A0A5R9LG87_9ENTR|nr:MULTISPECIES: MFS transporter [Klebsiella]TLV15602.1 MFS transporter [Klebsiella indica]
MHNNQKIPLYEKISYGLGDTACNLIYMVVTTYLTFYFTDVYGISVTVVGVLMLAVRFLDMIDSPVLGILIDKTNTRWGKSRPWILWFCIPFAASCIMLFWGPDLSATGKMIYAFAAYVMVSVFYSCVNNPLSTMLPSLTSDQQERTVANTFRMLGGQFGGLIVNMTLLPLVAFLGAGDMQKGFFATLCLYAVVGVALLLITFFNTRERVETSSSKQSLPFKEGIKSIKGNTPWLMALLLTIFCYICYTQRSTAAIYYLTYYIGQPDVVPIVNSLAMCSILGLFMVPFLTRHFDKRWVILVGYAVFALGQFIIFLGDKNLWIIYFGTVFGAIGKGFTSGLLFVMIADTVDFGEWKSGIRAQGLLVSTAAGIGIKLGAGLGGAIPMWILASGGYVANQPQSQESMNAIVASYIWVPIAFALICVLILLFFKYEKPFNEIIADLNERNKNKQPAQ